MSPRKAEEGRQVNMKLPEWVLRGINKLAAIDNRTGRNYLHVIIKRHVEEALANGLITLDKGGEKG